MAQISAVDLRCTHQINAMFCSLCKFSYYHYHYLLALLAFLPSVISSFFTQNKGEGPGAQGPPGLSPRSAALDPPLERVWNIIVSFQIRAKGLNLFLID